ncbi:MAG: T9SS type A sorting domain-containing protein [Candidatus Kapabacteria bacterium]|nr:T9SS type A sorting domain-containing protein [Candidatus Kapabacteria bacterium]
MRLTLILGLTLTLNLSAQSTDTVRICSYNLLKFAQSNEDGRIPMFARILDTIRPDVMICAEVADATVGPRFVSEVMKWGPYAATPYYEGNDTKIMVLYNQEMFRLVGTNRIPTELRDIFETTLEHLDAQGRPDDTLIVYGVHLKASSSSSDEQQRTREVAALTARMTSRRHVVIGGDYNVYRPDEPALQALIGPNAKRRFVDPLGSNWRRNDVAFASYYTQCTRATMISGCGGGVDGGIDDRFDFILASAEFSPRVLTSTYTAFGNDGAVRFNKSINDPPNQKVSADIAAALLCASDHLPIYVDVVLGDVPASVDGTDAPSWWTCDGHTITIAPGTADVSVYSSQGRRVAFLPTSNTTQRVDDLPTGMYILQQHQLNAKAVIVR